MYLKAEQPDNNLTEITEGQILNTNYYIRYRGKNHPAKAFY